MPSKQRNDVRQLAPLLQGNDCEGAATRSIPIDTQILGIDLNRARPSALRQESTRPETWTDLDQVSVPGIAADTKVIVAELLSRRFAKYMACRNGVSSLLGGAARGGEATHDTWRSERIGQPLRRFWSRDSVEDVVEGRKKHRSAMGRKDPGVRNVGVDALNEALLATSSCGVGV